MFWKMWQSSGNLPSGNLRIFKILTASARQLDDDARQKK